MIERNLKYGLFYYAIKNCRRKNDGVTNAAERKTVIFSILWRTEGKTKQGIFLTKKNNFMKQYIINKRKNTLRIFRLFVVKIIKCLFPNDVG